MTNSNKKRWPTEAVMEQIYSLKMWGGKEQDFYSGEGSHSPKIVNPYVLSVRNFLNSFSDPLRVLDLGCGDFNVGNQLVDCTSKYIAVDIVPTLIERNKQVFKQDSLEFHCLNISLDKWPIADCVIIRQVLQHLSNAEINQVLIKLRAYRYLILTEHIPVGDFEANKDIITGQGIRLKKKSGLDVLSAPFNFSATLITILNVINYDAKSKIVTTAYKIS